MSHMQLLTMILSRLGYDEMVDPLFTDFESPLIQFEFDPFSTASATEIGHKSRSKDLLIVTDGELNA